MFRLGNGKLLSPWTLVEFLRPRGDLKQYQIVQETPVSYVLNYAADAPLSAQAREEIRADFAKALEIDAEVEFERVAEVPRTSGGKFMIAISKLAPSETAALAR